MELLLIFCKNPVLGQVKTRLAQDIGAATALAVYQRLCQHTQEVVRSWGGQVAVFHADTLPEPNPWETLGSHQYPQQGADLGARMADAFQWGFARGYRKIVIIGSDLWTINAQDLSQAFSALEQHDVVWGPAQDGGYYLLGLNQLYPQLFDDLPWSQSQLLEKSKQRVIEARQFSLRIQNDIDTLTDLLAVKELAAFFEKHLP